MLRKAKFRCFLDYEELALLVMFTNLHHKLSLLVSLFSGLFAESLPNLDERGRWYLIRVLLHFFQKNQILNPDVYKSDPKNANSAKKRSFEDFGPESEIGKMLDSQSLISKMSVLQKLIALNHNAQQKNQKGPSRAADAKTSRGRREGACAGLQTRNMFSFVRTFMRSSALEILNLFEVTNAFSEKLLEFNLQSSLRSRR